MKVTNKKGVGFYYRAAASFFTGIEAKEATDDKKAVAAKPKVGFIGWTAQGHHKRDRLEAPPRAVKLMCEVKNLSFWGSGPVTT